MIHLPRALAAAAEVQHFGQQRLWSFCFIGGFKNSSVPKTHAEASALSLCRNQRLGIQIDGSYSATRRRGRGQFLDQEPCSGLLCRSSVACKTQIPFGWRARKINHTTRTSMKKFEFAIFALFMTVCALPQLCDAAQMALKL